MIKKQKKILKIGQVKPRDLEMSRNRLFVVSAVLSIVFCILSFRVIEVSVFGSGHKSNFIDMEDYSYNPVKQRADIVDRNGTLLAVNLATASLYANPHIIMDAEEALEKVMDVFPELDEETIRRRLSSDRSFVWIKRNLTPDEQYAVNALGVPGLQFKEEEKRVYPHRNLFSHALGMVNVDGDGLSGIEKHFDTYLKGTNDYGHINDPLQLSVDVRVQSIVRDSLLSAVEEFKAVGASAVVLDANTGEVVSMVSLPDFDLNDPGASPAINRFNRTTYGVYEMGSTLKTFTMALGMELGSIGMEDSLDVTKPLKVANFTIRDYHPHKGKLTVPEIFMQSSNIGTAKIAIDIGAEEQKSFLGRLGLLSGLDIEIPEKGEPLYPDKWGKISAMTISYGHGIAVTPMHVAKSTAALVNGGILNPVTLLKQSKYSFVNKGKRVVSQIGSDNIRKLMRFAVKHGTGHNAEVDGYLVGGKTGSADKASGGGYNEKSIISSFVGAFPMNEPKYVVFVMVDEPVGNARTAGYTTGGMVAAPVVRDIIKKIAPIVGVMPVDENNYEIRKEFWYDNELSKQEVALATTD